MHIFNTLTFCFGKLYFFSQIIVFSFGKFKYVSYLCKCFPSYKKALSKLIQNKRLKIKDIIPCK